VSPYELGDDDDELWYICAGCGTAITRLEVGGEFDGRFADYDMRMQGVANFVYCGECWEQTKQNMASSIKDAKQKRIKLMERLRDNDTTEDVRTETDRVFLRRGENVYP